MFTFDYSNILINKSYILQNIPPIQIFEMYCSNFKKLNRKFKSEFYNDTKPSCEIKKSKSGSYYYIDYGSGEYLSAFEYVKKKYSLNDLETCKKIYQDFHLGGNVYIRPKESKFIKYDYTNNINVSKPNFKILINTRFFNIKDFKYWDSFGIHLATLNFYNVKPCKSIITCKDNEYKHFKYTSLVYAYYFYYDNICFNKIYKPLAKKDELKWFGNTPSFILQGYEQLPENDDILIITKSLKDVMYLYSVNIPSVAIQSETTIIQESVLTELYKRFKNIVLLMDSDNQGRNITGEFLLLYDLPFFFIDKAKDISDFRYNFGDKTTIEMLKYKLKEILYYDKTFNLERICKRI